jgi:hypothetical protein
MAENAGAIRYTVETDTSSQLKAEKVVNTSTKNIEKDFQRVDKSIAKTSKNATKNIGKFGRASGQAGIQFQQFIGQIQGGQNAMLALSQQSADLGFVLGAPLLGAIVGISASVAGILAPSLLAGKDNTELLEKAIEQLIVTTAQASDGTIIFSEALEKLAKKSKAAAAVEIALGMQRAKEVIKLARIEVDELTSSWESFFSRNATGLDAAISQLQRLEKVAEISGETQVEVLERLGGSYEASVTGIGSVASAVNKLSKEYGLSTTESLVFVRALGEFKRDKSAETFGNLSTVVSTLATNMDKPNVKFIEMAKNINDTALNAKDASDSIMLYEQATNNVTEALSDNNSETIKNAESLESFIDLLRTQAATLGLTDRQLAIHGAAIKGATAAEIEQINILFDAIEAHDQRTEALKKEEAAIDKKARADERAANARARQTEREKEQLARQVSKTGLTPEQSLRLQQVAEIEILRQGFEQKLLTEQDFLTRSAELNRQHQDQVKVLQEKTTKDAIVNWDALEDQVAGTLGGIVTGALDGREAMASLAQSVLTQMVSALIQMGIQAVIGQTAAAAAGVATAATLATAYAPAAALASLASFGANAVPAAAGIASTVGLAQTLSLAGAREHGGPVSAGKSFLVGERGPEIFTPGAGGNVTSNKESFGGTTLNVLVENNTPSQVSTQLSDSGKQLKIIINEVARQISTNQGVIPKAMRQSTNTTFKTSR